MKRTGTALPIQYCMSNVSWNNVITFYGIRCFSFSSFAVAGVLLPNVGGVVVWRVLASTELQH
jgi:hypothetical protein